MIIINKKTMHKALIYKNYVQVKNIGYIYLNKCKKLMLLDVLR